MMKYAAFKLAGVALLGVVITVFGAGSPLSA